MARPGTELSAASFTPSEDSDNMSKLFDLAKLLQSPEGMPNYPKAANLAKGLIFKKAAPQKGSDFDIDKYLTRYQKLHEPQRNFLFNPQDQQLLESLGKYKESQGKGVKLTKSLGKLLGSMTGGAALGEMTGAHFGGVSMLPALIGMTAGALKGPEALNALTEAVTHLLPSSPKLLMKLLA